MQEYRQRFKRKIQELFFKVKFNSGNLTLGVEVKEFCVCLLRIKIFTGVSAICR